MKSRRNRRHEKIFEAMLSLGGEASLEQISKEAGLHISGLSQSLSVMPNVLCLGGKGRECRWKII